MFSKKDFQAWGKDNAILFASVMTKINDRQDDELLRTYGFRSFPSLALLDDGGEVVTKKFQRDLFSISSTVAAATSHKKISALRDAGDEYDKNAWFLARLGMGELSLDETKAATAELELTDAQKRLLDQHVIVMEMGQLFRKMRGRRGVRPEVKAEVCEAVYKTFKSGRRLPANSSLTVQFDLLLVDAAKKNNDGKAFNFSYKRVRQGKVDQMKSLKKRITSYEARIKEYQGSSRQQMVNRYTTAIERTKDQIVKNEKELTELDALAKKFEKGE